VTDFSANASAHLFGLCPACRLRSDLCLCASIPQLQTRSKIVVVIHSRELKKASNTARLCLAALPNSELRVQGCPSGALDLGGLVTPERQTLILFPHSSNPPLSHKTAALITKPVTLIVPDGTWTQARKIAGHVSQLPGAIRIALPPSAPSRYRLRIASGSKNGSHIGAGVKLCTLEAIARALGFIEPAPNGQEIQHALEKLLDFLVERSLLMRKRGAIR